MNRRERRAAEREGRRIDTLVRHGKPVRTGAKHFANMATHGFDLFIEEGPQFAAHFTRKRR